MGNGKMGRNSCGLRKKVNEVVFWCCGIVVLWSFGVIVLWWYGIGGLSRFRYSLLFKPDQATASPYNRNRRCLS